MASIDASKNVQDYEVELTTANQEYSLELPANAVAVEFKTRDGTAIRHAFSSGAVGTASPAGPYQTLAANGVYKKEHLYLSNKTIYFACGSASKIVEVRAWTV